MKRRVLIVEQGGRGGITDYTAALATALAAQGEEVVLATATDHTHDVLPGVRILPVFPYLRGGTRLRDAARRLRLQLPYNGLGFLLAYLRLVGEMRRARVVHVQGFDRPPLVVAAFAIVRAAGARIVHTPHNTFERPDRRVGVSLSLMARFPARIIVHAQADVPNLPAFARAKAVVIPHGEYGGLASSGGTASRAAARAAFGVDDDTVVALVFGQLRSDKGVGDVLRAARDVPGLHVVLAGEDLGALAESAALLDAPELAGRVTVRRGFQTMAQAAELFAACDVAVMAYPHASASGVLLLSYGFSRAVVAYPVGGLAEAVVDGETGWLTAAPEPAALAATFAEAVAAGPAACLARGAAGRAYSEEHFSWARIAERTRAVYAEVRG